MSEGIVTFLITKLGDFLLDVNAATQSTQQRNNNNSLQTMNSDSNTEHEDTIVITENETALSSPEISGSCQLLPTVTNHESNNEHIFENTEHELITTSSQSQRTESYETVPSQVTPHSPTSPETENEIDLITISSDASLSQRQETDGTSQEPLPLITETAESYPQHPGMSTSYPSGSSVHSMLTCSRHGIVKPNTKYALITTISDKIPQRGKELETVKNEAEHVSDELAFMKAFLRLADAMEESVSALRLLVKKVRDVAYDIEDALDEFRLCLANDNGHGIFSCFRKICRSVKDARARRRIASKIQAIKSRVISITESHRRYCNKNNIMVHGSSSDSTTRIECQRDALLLEEADLVGIEKPKKQLIERLLGTKSGREVVSVVGMGGLGKTTLVKRVYDDPDVKKHYKFRAWITVS
ncbi:hypothetical protein DKX38_004329 [Salix brachista]|uniref:NB-ARC domain-containing protein n=1 Tax=Salix brachista TaxID=2182728 RepID=A0A5N5N9T8_9ROSI|nr:hypothetical protein DKX38_004329 [Salix brachista]